MGRPRITQEEFIHRAQELHNNKYDYSKTKYHMMHKHVTITCLLHGDFQVLPCNHVKELSSGYSPSGCPECGRNHVIQRNKGERIPFEVFVSRADKVHSVHYSYVEGSYSGVNNKLTIICPEHGAFHQQGVNHLRGTGCPRCKNSRGETIIAKTLSREGIPFHQHYKEKSLTGVGGKPLEFDFYVPMYDMFIEYDGEHHERPVKYNRCMSDKEAKRVFEQTQIHDKLKDEHVERREYLLLRINYRDKERASSMVLQAVEEQRKRITTPGYCRTFVGG